MQNLKLVQVENPVNTTQEFALPSVEEPTEPTQDYGSDIMYQVEPNQPSGLMMAPAYPVPFPYQNMGTLIAVYSVFILIFVVLTVLDLILRGKALWKSAQAHEKWWFVALLLVNSMGILPAIYLLTHKNKSAEAPKPTV